LASFLLLSGSLSDRFGRKRLFGIGVIGFAVASAACGFAPSAGFLIATRVLQGVGGALLVTGSLAILEASFAPSDRGAAIGAWAGLGAVAFALIEGPGLGWSSIEVVAALALAIGALGTFAFVETRSPQPLLPLGMFRQRQFSSTNAITFLMFASVGGAFFLLPVQLQIGSGYSPLEAGAALLPVT